MRNAYPELFAVVGGNVPDFRGLFLRGVGGNSAGLGVYQHFEIQSHTHGVPYAANEHGDGAFDGGSGIGTYLKSQSEGGIETRPVNRAVRYLVRAKP